MSIHTVGDQAGNIRVWDLTAGACSCELVPEVGTAVRSLTVALDASHVVAANNAGAGFRSLSTSMLSVLYPTAICFLDLTALQGAGAGNTSASSVGFRCPYAIPCT